MAGFFSGIFGDKYGKELQELQKKVEKEPKNIRLWVRIGDLREKMEKRTEALEAYERASKEYTRNGFLIQAIAVNKLILRLDPSRAQIHDHLAELYAQWGKAGEEGVKVPEEEEKPSKVQVQTLPSIPLFSQLRKEELSRVMEKIRAKRLAKGQFICKEGDPGDSIFVISHGKVRVWRQDPGRGKIVLNELKEGDFFGEFGFFSNSHRYATVETAEETEILEITKADLQKIIQEFPSVSQILFNFYRERVLDNLLATSALFQSFSPAERKQILNHLVREEYPPGAMVIEEGASGDSMYIIKSGEVGVFTSDPQKGELPLAKLKEGDFFGEISLLTGRPRSASVKALQLTELLRLSKKDFDQIAKPHPEVVSLLEESLHVRLENKLRSLGVFRDNPGKERMI